MPGSQQMSETGMLRLVEAWEVAPAQFAKVTE